MPTDRRFFRVAKAIHQRQLDIVVALDGVHDQHNLSAVLRSADATGIGRVLWYPDVRRPEKLNPEVSKGSERWVSLEAVAALPPRLLDLKKQGYKVAATHMARKAVDYRSIDWTQPWVVVFGNEQRGCSEATIEVADANIFLPMMGFVQSLNISVAAAVTFYEIQRQRENAGMYSRCAPEQQIRELYSQWHLEDEQFSIEQLLAPPVGELPEMDHPHSDGRSVRKLPEVGEFDEQR
ncbi:MAG: RNA methyltransferase [Candidatus Riflebacteria bacterium]|nr:RNA methyltransferase [Candidatus Riflebacteria bacterium]